MDNIAIPSIGDIQNGDFFAGYDCQDFLESFASESIDHIITDPPYGTNSDWRSNQRGNPLQQAQKLMDYMESYELKEGDKDNVVNYIESFFDKHGNEVDYDSKCRLLALIDWLLVQHKDDPRKLGYAFNFIIPKFLHIHRCTRHNFAFMCDGTAGDLLVDIAQAIWGNEPDHRIIWKYKTKANSKGFHQNYDYIFVFSKSGSSVFNEIYDDYDNLGKVTKRNRKLGFKLQHKTVMFWKNPERLAAWDIDIGLDKRNRAVQDLDWNNEFIDPEMMHNGRSVCQIIKEAIQDKGFRVSYTPIPEERGGILGSVWDIPRLENPIRATQKPEKLGIRLLQSLTRPNDIVMDPFCGMGWILLSNQQLERQRITFGCDLSLCGKPIYDKLSQIKSDTDAGNVEKLSITYQDLLRLKALATRDHSIYADLEKFMIEEAALAHPCANDGQVRDGSWPIRGHRAQVLIEATTQKSITTDKINSLRACLDKNQDCAILVFLYLSKDNLSTARTADLRQMQEHEELYDNKYPRVQWISMQELYEAYDENPIRSLSEILIDELNLPEIILADQSNRINEHVRDMKKDQMDIQIESVQEEEIMETMNYFNAAGEERKIDANLVKKGRRNRKDLKSPKTGSWLDLVQ